MQTDGCLSVGRMAYLIRGGYTVGSDKFCPNCKRLTRVEWGFCRFCSVNLDPSLGILPQDYQAPDDRDAIRNLEMASMLMPIIRQVVEPARRDIEGKLLRSSLSLDKIPNIIECSMKCARILGLDRFPKLYLVGSKVPNAFAFGLDEKPAVALTVGLLKIVRREEELRVILGHEMGHIKSKHLEYHMLAEALTEGTSYLGLFMLGSDLLSLPLRMLLLAWHRSAEVTADRSSLITSGDIDAVKTTIMLPLISKLPPSEAKAAIKLRDEDLLHRLGGLLETHPSAQARINQVEEFYRSAEYRKISLELWEKRLILSQLLFCRFCNQPNLKGKLYCPSCGRSQV